MPPQQPQSKDKLKDKLTKKLKPASGFSHLVHILFQVVLAIVIFILVRLNIGLWLPLLVILLSKWRIFSVRPRFWPANLRANAVDIMVGVSIVIFMSHSNGVGDSMSIQLFWAVMYGLWLLFIKPRSSVLFISLQSAIGQLCGLMALFIISGEMLDFNFLFLDWTSLPLSALVLLGGLICYLSARHFFDSFNEPYAKLLAAIWGYFGAALLWVLGHMLVVYPKPDGIVTMPLLILSAIGYSLAGVYYLEHFDRLSTLLRRELLYISAAIIVILVISLYFEGASLIV